MDKEKFRAMKLSELGATASEVEELIAYNENVFEPVPKSRLELLPMEDEPFVTTWKDYEQQANTFGAFFVLQQKLIQLQFPIQAGISKTANYQAATRRGANTEEMREATGLVLDAPEKLELMIHQTSAGNIPVLIVRERNDFVGLVQALTKRNEPAPILDAVGAAMVAGYNNWDRIWQYKKAWEEQHFFGDWGSEFKKLVANRALYQDRFIILSDGAYSGVAAADLQLSEKEWRKLSTIIRREHEATHYFTERILGSMRNNMLDELIADYIGIVSAIGEYKVDWFLRFIGLENFPNCRMDGRIHRYRSSLSEGAFHILQILLIKAAHHLEQLNQHIKENPFTNKEKANAIRILSQFTLEELASEQGFKRLETAFKNKEN